MSFELVDKVLHLTGMHATEKVVLACLAQRANHDGTSSYPGQKYLAMRANVSTRAVRYTIDHLEVHGYLTIGPQRRTPTGEFLTNTYRLTIGQGVPCDKNQKICLRLIDQDKHRRKLASPDSVSTTTTTTRTTTPCSRGRVRTHVFKWESIHSPSKDFDSVSRAGGSQLPTGDDDAPKDIDWTPPKERPPVVKVDVAALSQRVGGLVDALTNGQGG